MSKRSEESKKRLHVIVLIILLSSIILVSSTYAWFSTQKDITLTNLKGTVQVSEGLEVSIDGELWDNEIDLEQLKHNGNSVIRPDELLPASSTGKFTGKYMQLFRGTLRKKIQLSEIKQCKEPVPVNMEIANYEYPSYIAFDMYLKNTNRKDDPTVLQLNKNSVVNAISDAEGGNEKAGLQNAIRVGFAKYSGVMDTLSTKSQILAKDFGPIEKVAIWEPNSKVHADYVVTNNNKSPTHPNFTKNQEIETYGLLPTAVTGSVSNVYADETHNELQQTVKTNSNDKKTAVEGVVNLKEANAARKDFTIPANQITKIRVYLWIEGGDIDCINYASYGGGVNATIGLIKDAPIGK